MEFYYRLGETDVAMVELLKEHYDTNKYGLGYVIL
jgi:hypothetical protein